MFELQSTADGFLGCRAPNKLVRLYTLLLRSSFYLDEIAEAGGDNEANDEALLEWGDVSDVTAVVDAGNNAVAGVVELGAACDVANVGVGKDEVRSAGVDKLNGVGDVAVVVETKGPGEGTPVWDMGMSLTILRGTWKKGNQKLTEAKWKWKFKQYLTKSADLHSVFHA